MSLAVKSLFRIMLITVIVAVLFDMMRLRLVKRSLYEASRAANQDSLWELQQAIQQQTVLTDEKMVQQWIINYALQSSVSPDQVKIVFTAMNTEPQYYLVSVSGSREYRFLSATAASSFRNGALVISDIEP